MGRGIIRDDVTDNAGNAIQGKEVTIYIADTVTKATLYDASTGGSEIGNPVVTDEDGVFEAYADTGEYEVEIDGQIEGRYNAVDGDELADLLAIKDIGGLTTADKVTYDGESANVKLALDARVPTVATLGELQAFPTTVGTVKYQGLEYTWTTGDYSPEITADGVGYYVKSNDFAATAGAWIAEAVGGRYYVEKCDSSGGTDYADAIERVAAILPRFGTIASTGIELPVSRTPNLDLTNPHYAFIDIATLVPSGAFDDYLLHANLDTGTSPVGVGRSLAYLKGQITVDCKNQARGVKLTRIDDTEDLSIKVLRPYGTGLKVNLCRESIYHVMFQAGRNRTTAASGAADWSSGTDYTVGQYVRRPVASWSSGTTYAQGDIARAADGLAYISAVDSNLANNPSAGASPDFWRFIPDFYFKAVLASGPSGVGAKDPDTFNTHNATEADRFWLPVTADEPLVDMQQDEGFGDITNNILFHKPIFHECDNKIYFNIDSPENRVIRNIDMFSPFIHYPAQSYIDSGLAETGQQIYNGVTLIRYGHSYRCGIYGGGNVRTGADSDDSIHILAGTPYDARQHQLSIDTRLSGEGDRLTGFMKPTSNTIDDLAIDFLDVLGGADPLLILIKTPEHLKSLTYGREVRQGYGAGVYEAIEDEVGAGAVAVRQSADTNNRVELRSNGRIYLGNGSGSPDTHFQRGAAGAGRPSVNGGLNYVLMGEEATAAQIADRTASINTTNKHRMKMVYDSTNNRMYYSRGSTDVAAWRPFDDASGAGDITPA